MVCPIPECQLPQHVANFDSSGSREGYSHLLFERGRRSSPALVEILRDVILADPSDYGVDLAVGKIFGSHQLGTHRWEQFQLPNTRWLTCKTETTEKKALRTVHINLLNGELRVDGQPLGGSSHKLPLDWSDPQPMFHTVRMCCNFCHQCVHTSCAQQGFFVIPSNLSGMDFTILAMTSKRKVTV